MFLPGRYEQGGLAQIANQQKISAMVVNLYVKIFDRLVLFPGRGIFPFRRQATLGLRAATLGTQASMNSMHGRPCGWNTGARKAWAR